jgi:hypothetical protein
MTLLIMVAAALLRILEIILFTAAGVFQGIRQDFNLVEIALLIALFATIWRGFVPELRWVTRWEERLSTFAVHRRAACWTVGVAAIVIRSALIPVLPVPEPVVADEFSHLLMADTLLHGRVANPTHPLWIHFETLHVIQRPHYASNYFPGQGAVLAASHFLSGHPWPGIVLLSGICCGVICWMLQGWMPARWALLGGGLAVLRFAIGSYWVNSYYGGFLPAIGGALVAGSYPRLVQHITFRRSLVFGLGLSILAFTRPYEGLFFVTPFVAALLLRSWRDLRFVLPVAVTAALTLSALGGYFYRITGSPVITSYSVNQKEYGWPMSFAWASPATMHHRATELHRFYLNELDEHNKVDSIANFVQFLAFRLQEYWRFFMGPMLTIPLLFLGGIWRNRRLRVLLLAIAGALCAVLLVGAASPHYISPATGAIMALIVEGIRRLRLYRVHGRPAGVLLSRAVPAMLALVLVLRICAANAGWPYTQKLNYQSWCCKVQGDYGKMRATEYLRGQPGRHLVIVKAKQDPVNLLQWIYNDADIDSSRIVWARDLDPWRNAELMAYFEGRQVWTIDPNIRDPMPQRIYSREHSINATPH